MSPVTLTIRASHETHQHTYCWSEIQVSISMFYSQSNDLPGQRLDLKLIATNIYICECMWKSRNVWEISCQTTEGEDNLVGWSGRERELWGLRGHLERVGRRGVEKKNCLLWTLWWWDWWWVTKVCCGSHLPTAGWGNYCMHAAGLENFSSRNGVKYSWPCKSTCSCLLMARWTSGFDTHPRGDIPTHWARWLQPPSRSFPGLSHADGCGEREKNPLCCPACGEKREVYPRQSAVGSSGGSSGQARQEAAMWGLCMYMWLVYILHSSADTLWRATLLRRMHSASKSGVWNPKN